MFGGMCYAASRDEQTDWLGAQRKCLDRYLELSDDVIFLITEDPPFLSESTTPLVEVFVLLSRRPPLRRPSTGSELLLP